MKINTSKTIFPESFSSSWYGRTPSIVTFIKSFRQTWEAWQKESKKKKCLTSHRLYQKLTICTCAGKHCFDLRYELAQQTRKTTFCYKIARKLFWAKKVHNLLISQIVNNCQEFSNVGLPVCILMGELPYVV